MQAAAPVQTGKLWNRVFVLAMIVSGLSGLSNGMLAPALPIFVGSLGHGTDIAGTVVAIATFLSMFGRGLSGGWSDRISRKTILLVSLACSTVAFLLFSFARTIPLVLLAKCMQGVSSGIIITVLCTIAFDTLPPHLMGSGIGMFSLAGSLAQCIAPSIGTALASRGLYVPLFLASAIASAASFAVLLTIPVQPTQRARERALAKANGTLEHRGFHISDYICREALPAAFLLLMNGIIHSAISNYLSICGISRGVPSVAIFFTINSIVLIVSRPLCGRIADRMHIAWLIVPGYIFMGGCCIAVASAHSILPFCIAGVFYGIGFGATQCAGQLMAIRSVGLDRRSIANSTYYVGGDIGLALGASLAGVLAAAVGYAAMYLLIAAVCFVTLILYVLYAIKTR